ncbi:peptide deformylase [Bacillus sp. SCS-153A]|uniref:peptide deformylase n=1 Tax=Rossellomorea sedimentorum TaxID=3115294 RepID=UPI003905BD91
MITMNDIIREGHPSLRKTAEEVAMPPSAEDKEILSSLLQYVKNSQDPETAQKYGLRSGIGLAAPQINVLKRMLAIHVTDKNGELHSYALFNPKIVSHSVEKAYLTSGEGCLSVDRQVPGYVPRYSRVTIKGMDIDGNPVKVRMKGLPAIVFQHEIDHLNGVMFYDHIDQENPLMPIPDATPIDR